MGGRELPRRAVERVHGPALPARDGRRRRRSPGCLLASRDELGGLAERGVHALLLQLQSGPRRRQRRRRRARRADAGPRGLRLRHVRERTMNQVANRLLHLPLLLGALLLPALAWSGCAGSLEDPEMFTMQADAGTPVEAAVEAAPAPTCPDVPTLFAKTCGTTG